MPLNIIFIDRFLAQLLVACRPKDCTLMKQILRTRWIVAAALVGVLLLVALYSLFGSLNGSSERIVYIDSDDTVDSV